MKTKLWLCSGLVGLVGCSNEVSSSVDEPVAATEQAFYYASDRVWPNPEISVCWKIGSPDVPERDWVRQAVEAAFEPFTNVNFTGWGTCTTAGAHVVIQTITGRASAPVVPRAPSTTPNMFLNLYLGFPPSGAVTPCWTGDPINQFPHTGITGREWDNKHRACVEVEAVHEFFHAVSAMHEQNRVSETPAWCLAQLDPSDFDGLGDTAYGYWDATSVSNYCNRDGGDGYLSQLDYSGLDMLYGWRSNDRVWYGIGNVRYHSENVVEHDQVIFETRAENFTGDYEIAVGDFDGDGEDDILMYREGSAKDYVQFGRSSGGFDQVEVSATSPYDPIAGDFDGDGNDDIFWYAPGSAEDKLWFGKSNRSFDKTTPDNVTGAYTKLIAGNFDGDGEDDLFLYAAGSTADKILFGQSNRTFAVATPSNVTNTYEPFTGNFDGDSEDDIFWYRPGTGADAIWFGNSNRTFTSLNVTVNGDYTPAAGDFDGNGTTDVLWNDAGENDPLWLFSENTRGLSFPTWISSIIGDQGSGVESAPFAGNFDGDNRDDVLWYKAN